MDSSRKEHFEIGEALGLMDFDAAAKSPAPVSSCSKGALARLERALEQFMLDLHTSEHGYVGGLAAGSGARRRDVRHRAIAEVRGRSILGRERRSCSASRRTKKSRSWTRSTPRPRWQAGLSAIKSARFGLIPTAEVPLTNLVRESIVDEKTLPLRFTGGYALAFARKPGPRGATRGA